MANTFKLNNNDVFFHASNEKRKGRLKKNNAPQFGTGVYFSSNKDLVLNQFGKELTIVKLSIVNPVYTNTKEWVEVQQEAIKLADQEYGKNKKLQLNDDDTYFRYDSENLSEIDEIPSYHISNAAIKLGYDAIIDQASVQYENEIVVLDESKIIYVDQFNQGGSVGHLLAPNGKPSNLTPQQHALVRTAAFIAWFGDWINNPEASSKVVDENGEPLVVYHGYLGNIYSSKKNFTVFKRMPSFFSESKDFAYNYASTKSMDMQADADIMVYECFLNSRKLFNPLKKENIDLADKMLPEKIEINHGTAWFLSANIDKKDLLEEMAGIETILPDSMTEDIQKANIGDVLKEKVSASQYENKILLYKDEDWAYTIDEMHFYEILDFEIADHIFKDRGVRLDSTIEYKGEYLKRYVYDEENYRYVQNTQPLYLEFLNEVEKRKQYYFESIESLIKNNGKKSSAYITITNPKGRTKEMYVRIRNLKSFKTSNNDNWTLFENETVQKFLIENNFDGWVSKERKQKTYAVYNPNQIKLADGSNTKFNNNKPDIRFEQGGSIDITPTNYDKAISASSRFRPYEMIVFEKPIIGNNGNKLVSYQWAYEWTMQPSKNDTELKSKRVSDWTQAEISAETGRGIVHKFTVERTDGIMVTVSSETVPSLLGYVDARQVKNLPSLISAVKTLAKLKMQLAILDAQKAEYDKLTNLYKKQSKPEIIEIDEPSRFPGIQDDYKNNEHNVYQMGDVWLRQDNPYKYNSVGKVIYTKLSSPSKSTIEALQLDWVRKRVEEAGGINPKGLYDLKRRIERQVKKVEQLTYSKLNEAQQTVTSSFEQGGSVMADVKPLPDEIIEPLGKNEYPDVSNGIIAFHSTSRTGAEKIKIEGLKTGMKPTGLTPNSISFFAERRPSEKFGETKIKVVLPPLKLLNEDEQFGNLIDFVEKKFGRTANSTEINTSENLKEFGGYDGIITKANGGTEIRIYNPDKISEINELNFKSKAIDKFLDTFEQGGIVRSNNFKQWFKNSKVVDKKGNPIIVYHGSPDLRFLKSENVFKNKFSDDAPFFFTDNYAMAKSYADPKRAYDYQNAEEGVLSFYLNLENPLVVNADNQIWRKFEIVIDGVNIVGTRSLINYAKSKNYDSLIVNNVRDYYNNNDKKVKGGNVYAAFSPNQIKLADGTNTTFNNQNPDIRFQSGGITPSQKKYDMQNTSELHQQLIAAINTHLDLCEMQDTPVICGMINEPENRQKVIDAVIDIILKQKLDVPQAIIQLDNMYNINHID